MNPSGFDLGRAASQAWKTFMRDPFKFALIAAPAVVLDVSSLAIPSLWFVLLVVTSILYVIPFAALIQAAADASAERPVSLIRVYGAVGSRLANLFDYQIRFLFAVGLLAITLIGIPFAIRIGVRWFFGAHAVMLRDLPSKDAISYSCRIVTGFWWQVAIVSFLLLISTGSLPLLSDLLFSYWSIEWILVNLVSALVAFPLTATFWTRVFFQLEDSQSVRSLELTEGPATGDLII